MPTIFEEIGGQLAPVYDWRRAGPALADAAHLPRGFHFSVDLDALGTLLNAPERVLLGQAQEQWFGLIGLRSPTRRSATRSCLPTSHKNVK
jgi:hypothetical protein